MRWYVTFKTLGIVGEVEAGDRWGAVVVLAKRAGIADKVKMQILFDDASIRKIDRATVYQHRAARVKRTVEDNTELKGQENDE